MLSLFRKIRRKILADNKFGKYILYAIGEIVLIVIGILIALLLVDWRVGLAFSIFAVITLFSLNAVRGIAIPHQKKMREAIADLFGYLEERLAGTEDIRSSGAVEFVLLGLYKLHFRILGHWRDAWRRFVLVRFTAGMLLTLGITLSFISGYFLYL